MSLFFTTGRREKSPRLRCVRQAPGGRRPSPLPPPELPRWRDTPEREAYFRELGDRLAFSKIGCCFFAVGLSLTAIGQVLLARRSDSFGGPVATSAGVMLLLLLLLGMAGRWLFWRLALAVKYRVLPMRLKHPDVSAAVAAVMAARPDFDETAFRNCWPSERHAEMALKIIGWVRESWSLPEKMLYPDDPLMLLYAHPVIGDEEDFADHFAGIAGLEGLTLDYENTFAELVEPCVAGADDCRGEGRNDG